MFTFATTVTTAIGAATGCEASATALYGGPCTPCGKQDDGGVNDDGGTGPLYGLVDANDDSGDAGEDAD